MSSSSIDQVAQSFVQYYYSAYSQNRPSLAALYQDSSMLTFEGQQIQGASGIIEKLTSLPATPSTPAIDTLDAQPAYPTNSGAILIFITGRMQLEAGGQAIRFSQTWQLVPTSTGSYFIHNDIFRLNYG